MIVTLTDFGISEYLGVMRGVIFSIFSEARVVDLFNAVSPQCIKEGAWVLLQNYKCFPKNSIFLCVVDPGVGSNRQAVVVKTNNYFFVGPDNGLMFPAAEDDGVVEVIEIDIDKMGLDAVSKTFHGRDIFARVAGFLEAGENYESFGKKTILESELKFFLNEQKGEVVRIDVFGNIITNIPSLKKDEYTVSFSFIGSKKMFVPFYKNYINKYYLTG